MTAERCRCTGISTIHFLFYFVLLLLQKEKATREELTRLVRELAIQNAKK